MTFAAPLALGIAIAAALGVVAWHLIATQRPPSLTLPTARFVAEGEARAASRTARPTDLLLLALRVAAVLLLGLAFAGPRFAPQRAGMARVVVADASRAAQRDVTDSATRAFRSGDAVVWFDSVAQASTDGVVAHAPSGAQGRLAAGLVRAHVEATRLLERTDSVELVIVSPLSHEELDAAVEPLLARWPGPVTVMRSAMATPLRGVVRLVTEEPSPADSAAVRAGATVVWWPTRGADSARADAVWAGSVTVVAPMHRLPMTHEGRIVARWSDGFPAASERAIGAGCLRRVSIGVPRVGDLSLQPGFIALAETLRRTCAEVGPPLEAREVEAMLRVRSGTSRVQAAALADPRVTLWLLVLAAAVLVVELLVRRRGPVPV